MGVVGVAKFTLVVSDSVTLWTVAHQAPLSVGFSRQGCCSGLLCPSPGDLPDPGIKPTSPALTARFFTTSTTWEASGWRGHLKDDRG